ncbi:DUF4123 domain-containing protein [Pseudomonas defluvii]|uniref:DUF4123 domain-containing protein n=1 Tax=Pseudomonas defluvii TaxID=1876757 RepID=UPI00390625A1
MTTLSPRQWMAEQLRQGCSLCLVLDAQDQLDTRQALAGRRSPDRYSSIYSATPVAELAGIGPFLFILGDGDDDELDRLINAPDGQWGWFASLREDGLPEWVEHWRERLLIGTRPHQALYRFQDPRVLSRALAHMPVSAVAEYLGTAISVCYWQGACWAVTENPAPGRYPLPPDPAWLHVPAPAQLTAEVRHTNAHRYLLAEHLEAYAALAERHPPDLWLTRLLELAERWGWQQAAQLEFLLTQNLQSPDYRLPAWWEVQPGEGPSAHFERVYLRTRFSTQGGSR